MVWRPFLKKDRTPVEARQGYRDWPVLWVLIVSLGAAALILGILYALYLG